jgi:hypothetical protein
MNWRGQGRGGGLSQRLHRLTEDIHESSQSGQPVSVQTFEPRVSLIRTRGVNNSTAAYGTRFPKKIYI